MKTQIIRLEPYDDIYSAKDKMGWGQTARILLVYPHRGRVLNRSLDLIMLKRHSAELGSQLALVTVNAQIKLYAQDLGIPVFNTIRQAEKSHWRPERKLRTDIPLTVKRQSIDRWRRRRLPMNLHGLRAAAHPHPPRWITHPFTRITAFTFGVLAVMAIAALLLPSAEINLSPDTHTDTITISVAASPDFQVVDLSGTVPARSRSIIVEGRSSISTSGSIPIPDTPAVGHVTFINLTDRSIPLPQGTVVSTLDEVPIRFRTTDSTAVPPEEEGIEVAVEAISPGSIGNTPPGSILAIEGPLGLDLIVSNDRATHGGSDRSAPAPSEEDYQQLYDQLFNSLAASALEEIKTSLNNEDLLISKQAEYLVTLEEIYTPAEIVPADQLQLVLRMEFQTQIVQGEDLRNLGQAALEANLMQGYSANPETMEIQHLSSPTTDAESNLSNWRMKAQWQTAANLDTTQAIKLAIGLSPNEAAQRIDGELPLAKPPQIRIFPSWWPRMPFLPFRITVTDRN